MTPCQIPENENLLPIGYVDYSNQNADDLLKILENNNIPILDLRKEMIKDGISYTDAFLPLIIIGNRKPVFGLML